jgi:hypothetical protein
MSTESITEKDRFEAVQYLSDNLKNFTELISGLTTEQLYFSIDSDSWSIAECLDHITSAEMKMVHGIMRFQQSPSNPELLNEITFDVESILIASLDRTTKFQSPENLKPGQFSTVQHAIDLFITTRSQLIEWLNATQDDLYNHIDLHPKFGYCDSYQWMFIIGGHAERHLLQIEEIMEHQQFPVSSN